MIINKAILHVLDFNSDVYVFSEKEMDFSKENIQLFLEKHIEKSFTDSGRKQGEFLSESTFKLELSDYIEGNLDFKGLSLSIAKKLHEQISRFELPVSTDVVVVEFSEEGERYFGILLYENKMAYTHNIVNDDDGAYGQVVCHYAILPNPSQKVDTFAIINLSDLTINFVDKKRKIDGNDVYVLQEVLLKCTSSISTKEAVKLVSKIASKVADGFGANTTKTLSKAKSYFAESAEESDSFSVVDLGKDIFADSAPMLQEFENKVREAGITKEIKLDKEYVTKTVRNHKIKTDTGIEITFPVDYFDDTKYIEFINNVDGTISIELKNIGKIIDK